MLANDLWMMWPNGFLMAPARLKQTGIANAPFFVSFAIPCKNAELNIKIYYNPNKGSYELPIKRQQKTLPLYKPGNYVDYPLIVSHAWEKLEITSNLEWLLTESGKWTPDYFKLNNPSFIYKYYKRLYDWENKSKEEKEWIISLLT